MSAGGRLQRLEAGQVLVFGGNRTTTVPDALAAAFVEGDRLVVDEATGDLLHIPQRSWEIATGAIDDALAAFDELQRCDDAQISEFFCAFAARLDDPAVAEAIGAANAVDVERARRRGRATGRLVLSETMRAGMVDGLRMWAGAEAGRSTTVGTHEHEGWSVELRRAPLGVVGFVFEGRPNVFADAAGVVRAGNTAVLRIGSDALGTARAILDEALRPALDAARLPRGTISLLDDEARAGGWALFADGRLALGVARGSGPAIAQLGAVGRQSGVPMSLHGTGGAWLLVGEGADPARLRTSIANSLDRKVCNTVNVCAVPAGRPDLAKAVLAGIDDAAQRRHVEPVLHADPGAAGAFLAGRPHRPIEREHLGTEWEWDDVPEVSIVAVGDLDEAIALCNEHSPQFVVSVVSEDDEEVERVYQTVNAPFVGDGFTRWVDGQYALGTPELGLSNWQFGRQLARGAILSGDSVHTIRYRAAISDPDLSR